MHEDCVGQRTSTLGSHAWLVFMLCLLSLFQDSLASSNKKGKCNIFLCTLLFTNISIVVDFGQSQCQFGSNYCQVFVGLGKWTVLLDCWLWRLSVILVNSQSLTFAELFFI